MSKTKSTAMNKKEKKPAARPGCPVLLTEGEHDDEFFARLAMAHGIQPFHIPDCPTNLSRGVGSFADRLRSLTTQPYYLHAPYILVVSDNDESPNSSFQAVAKDIENANIWQRPQSPRKSSPPHVDSAIPPLYVLMLPWDDEPGCLETLCYQAATNLHQDLDSCIVGFVDCIGASDWAIQHKDKMKARCMISALCESNPNTTMRQAWSSDRRLIFPLNDRCFDNLVKFLRD